MFIRKMSYLLLQPIKFLIRGNEAKNYFKNKSPLLFTNIIVVPYFNDFALSK